MSDPSMPPPTGAPQYQYGTNIPTGKPVTFTGDTMSGTFTPMAPPAKSRTTMYLGIALAVVVALLVGVLAMLLVKSSEASKAQEEAAATAATLTQVKEDLADAEREVTDANGKVSAAEIRADKFEECARGLWSTLSSAVDEDWVTAYGELSEVKAVCLATLGNGGGSL